MKTILQNLRKVKRLSQILLFTFISLLLPHNVATAETTNGSLGENQAIFEKENFYTYNINDIIFTAQYDGKYYVMGKQRADGKRAANAAIDVNTNQNRLIADKTTADIFEVGVREIEEDRGGYPYYYKVYSLKNDDSYLIDKYGIDNSEHGFATASMSDSELNENLFYWRNNYGEDIFNYFTNGIIFLVVDGTDLYFDVLSNTQGADDTHIKAECFSISCQHPNMQHVAAAEPTCHEYGYEEEFWYCPDCKAKREQPYFSDAIGLNNIYSPPIIMPYGAIDNDNDGICDDCGKNMPVFRKVTEADKILVGAKYILITQVGDKYYAVTTGTKEGGEILPATEVVPSADGSFTFKNTTSAMMFELQFAAGNTEWGNGMRYGLLTKFNNKPMTFNPYDDFFYFEEYREKGSKYGFYVGLKEDGTAKISSAYDSNFWIRSYTHEGEHIFTLKDYSSDNTYKESNVYFYRLTETGTVGTNTYDMTDVKSETNYDKIIPEGSDAEKATTVTGIADAMTQTAVNTIVGKFATENGISESNITVEVSADITATEYSPEKNATFDITPNATLSADGKTANYPISDSDFNVTAMSVTIYTNDIFVEEVIHEKEDGTEEHFYKDDSDEVREGEKAFSQSEDMNGNNYVTFTVSEFSKVKVIRPQYGITVIGGKATNDENVEITETPANRMLYIIADDPAEGEEFDKWEVVSGDVLIDEVNSATTRIWMHKTDVSIKAVYKKTTGIQNVSKDETEGKIYNPQGQLLNNKATRSDLQSLPAGIYIINGQKVIVK